MEEKIFFIIYLVGLCHIFLFFVQRGLYLGEGFCKKFHIGRHYREEKK